MTTDERAIKILTDIKAEKGVNPVHIFKNIATKDYISIHGPEHHILDGAAMLVAYKNAGGDIDLDDALNTLLVEGLKMPGAMCGKWGICGAITSIGAVLSVIDKTGPLSSDGTWGEHMSYTANALKEPLSTMFLYMAFVLISPVIVPPLNGRYFPSALVTSAAILSSIYCCSSICPVSTITP